MTGHRAGWQPPFDPTVGHFETVYVPPTLSEKARDEETNKTMRAIFALKDPEDKLSVALAHLNGARIERDRWRDLVAEIAAIVNPGGFLVGPWAKIRTDAGSGLLAFAEDSPTERDEFRERFGSAMPPSARRGPT